MSSNIDADSLSKSLITDYKTSFMAGNTWNYYNWLPRFRYGDKWISRES